MEKVDVLVSTVVRSDGKKVAYALFSLEDKSMEIVYPDLMVKAVKGFSEEEQAKLLQYAREHKQEIMKKATEINVMNSFMGKR